MYKIACTKFHFKKSYQIKTISYDQVTNYSGAPEGPTSAIFATIDLDPLYFEVLMFLAPSNPPYMSKMCSV